MVLIECFTQAHVDNIAACLRLRPEKVYMLGKAEAMAAPVNRYRELLAERKQPTRIELCPVDQKDFEEICKAIKSLLQEEDTYVIDLTGGDALTVMAVGAVLASLDGEKRKTIHVEKYDFGANAIVDCVNDNCTISQQRVELTVKEMIRLHGGALIPGAFQVPADCSSEDVDRLWRLASQEPKEWNREMTLLNEFESRADSKTQVYLPLAYFRDGISNFAEKEQVVRRVLNRFQQYGIISARNLSENSLEYTYRSPVARHCTLMAGNVLEVKTLLEGREILENGKPFVQDCCMSASIDWDGVLYDPEEHVPETRNEIDVVFMRGTTPLFVSCKNGNIGDEELYKLHTVATRFGGPYAKKMLIATELDQKSAMANRAFIQRAWDMDIFLVTDAADLSKEEWQEIFQKAMQ